MIHLYRTQLAQIWWVPYYLCLGLSSGGQCIDTQCLLQTQCWTITSWREGCVGKHGHSHSWWGMSIAFKLHGSQSMPGPSLLSTAPHFAKIAIVTWNSLARWVVDSKHCRPSAVSRNQNIMWIQIINSKPEYHEFSYFACKTGSQTVKRLAPRMHQISPFLSWKIKKKFGKGTPHLQTPPPWRLDLHAFGSHPLTSCSIIRLLW